MLVSFENNNKKKHEGIKREKGHGLNEKVIE